MYRTAQSAIVWRIDDLYLAFRFGVGRQEGWRQHNTSRGSHVLILFCKCTLSRAKETSTEQHSIAALVRDTEGDCRILLAGEVALASETPTSALSFLLQKRTSRSRPSRARREAPPSHYTAFLAYLCKP